MEMYPGSIVNLTTFAPVSGLGAGPAFFRGSLAIAGAPTDTYLSLCGWTKGFFIVNGFNAGRFWETQGPQHAFYIPASLLKTGANDIVVFEQHVAVFVSHIRKDIIEVSSVVAQR